MKFLVGFCILAVVATKDFGDLTCSMGVPELPNEWIDLRGECVGVMRRHIQNEIDASYQYLVMGAYFSRDTVNRPGFAEMFFNAATEGREHGSRLIEYLSMRGELTNDVTNLIRTPPIREVEWESGASALEYALKMETEVTKSIRKLIQICEKRPNFYHLVDFLSGDYLEKQLHGQRELAGKLSTLKKLMARNGALGEFLFDENL